MNKIYTTFSKTNITFSKCRIFIDKSYIMNKKNLYEPYKAIDGEIWKNIPSCKNYEVSNYGRVRLGDFIVVPEDRYGYCAVRLRKTGEKRITNFLVHRLVAECFIKNVGKKPEVDHIDTNKKNNNVENLRWCWHLENMIGNKTTLSKLNKGYRKKVIYESIRRDLYYRELTGSEIVYDSEVKEKAEEILSDEKIDNLLIKLEPSNFGKKTVSKLHPTDDFAINKDVSHTLFISINDIHAGMSVKIGEKEGKIIGINTNTKSIIIRLKNSSLINFKFNQFNLSLV